MAQCITCGSELHPDRAKKYNYCLKPECQEKNLKGLNMVAIGVNKSAEQYLLLDEQTQNELASGKFADQRRGSFGTSVPTSNPSQAGPDGSAPDRPAPPPVRVRPGPSPRKPNPVGPSPDDAVRLRRARRSPGPPATRGPNPRSGWRCCTTSRASGPRKSHASSA